MKPSTIKAVVGMAAVTIVAVAYFIWGCDQASIYPLTAAILILAGKELAEYAIMRNGEG